MGGSKSSVCREGRLSFHHFDPVAQALSKAERGHEQDIRDVQEMIAARLVNPAEALALAALETGLAEIERNETFTLAELRGELAERRAAAR